MSAKWEVAVNPVTFQPVLALKLNERRTNVEIPIEVATDRPSENDFMLMVINQMTDLSDEQMAEAFTALVNRGGALAIVPSIPTT